MALTKRVYVDGETIITAANLNAIQDEIISQESNKVPITRTVNAKALSSNITLSATDVGAAPTAHASSATTYGIGTGSNYGHVKLSDSLTDTTTAATGGVVPSMKTISDLNSLIANINLSDVQNVSTASTDLDSYTTGGIWFFPSAYTPSNKPSGAGDYGFLVALYGGGVNKLTQIWIDSARTRNNYYFRSNSTSGSIDFSDWKKAISDTDIEYADGDTFSETGTNFSGLCRLSGKQYRFRITLPKYLHNITTVTVTTCTSQLFTTGGVSGGYTNQTDWLTESDVTVSASVLGDNTIDLSITTDPALSNATNGACSFYGSLGLSFSTT